jgi:hypothetical protein
MVDQVSTLGPGPNKKVSLAGSRVIEKVGDGDYGNLSASPGMVFIKSL